MSQLMYLDAADSTKQSGKQGRRAGSILGEGGGGAKGEMARAQVEGGRGQAGKGDGELTSSHASNSDAIQVIHRLGLGHRVITLGADIHPSHASICGPAEREQLPLLNHDHKRRLQGEPETTNYRPHWLMRGNGAEHTHTVSPCESKCGANDAFTNVFASTLNMCCWLDRCEVK